MVHAVVLSNVKHVDPMYLSPIEDRARQDQLASLCRLAVWLVHIT